MMTDDGTDRGRLRFDADRLRRFTPVAPASIALHQKASPDRAGAEVFLDQAYGRAFGGKIRRHYPEIMTLRDQTGGVLAAVGFRRAAHDPLFLEQYLDHPVEQAVALHSGRTTERRQIAEIGSLASNNPGASLILFLALARHLDQQGCALAVATATRQLRRSFARVGFETRQLAAADRSRLAGGAEDWGSYYETDPVVLVGEIAPALPALAQLMATCARRQEARVH